MLWVWLVSVPLISLNSTDYDEWDSSISSTIFSKYKGLTIIELIGLIISFIGFLIETWADFSKLNFK